VNRFDEERLDFHTRVREGYLKLAAAEPDRFKVIDASQSVEGMHEQVLSLVLKLLEG
jgi:dTMP kinase